MNYPQITRQLRAIIPGITGLLFISASLHAAEKDELASVQRQLDQAQAALERARVAVAQADLAEHGRYFFDYRQATSDLNTIHAGIDRYLQPSKAQPTTSNVTGNYRRERP
ncbi:RAQPRD family integrative conjugative element protein [Erwiniaceae bacterium L1_54_6]|jgi:RAQPRD family integrative conjugative element protein|nr:RAQPRD family integrative conjugative element protein [Erwiniaceae bacterium L1_54_6]